MNSDAYKDFTAAALARTAAALKALGITCVGPREEPAESRETSDSRRFTIGFAGKFIRGASTIINVLLEQEVLPTGVVPCSTVPIRVTYGAELRAELRMHGGSVREIGLEELPDYVTRLTEGWEDRTAGLDEAVVYSPCRLCRNGVDLIDIPGLDLDDWADHACERVLPKLDAVVMVVAPSSPFCKSEEQFFRSKLIRFVPDRLILLINKIDTLRSPDILPRIVERVKAIIQEAAREELAVWYGEDSRQYQDTVWKLDSIHIFPVSAIDAMEGIENGDQELMERSGMEPFQAALTEMYEACKPV